MASKKKNESIKGPPESGPSASGASPGYIVDEWSCLPLYECSDCPFSTTDLRLIKEHVVKHMDPVIKTVRVETSVIGADDKPIVKEVEIEERPKPEDVPDPKEIVPPGLETPEGSEK